MAIDTAQKKLAVMEWDNYAEPGLPFSPGVFDQADKQQLLWGYPGVLWTAPAIAIPYGRRIDLKRGMNTSRIDLVRGG